MTPRILIAGIGNIFLGDDGFGSEVAQQLLRRPRPDNVHVVDFGIRGFDLAYALLDGADVAIFIDATPRGGIPGTLYVIEHEPICSPTPSHHPECVMIDTHAMDPLKVLRLAAAMGEIPKKILIVGCEPTAPADTDDMRMGLTDPVRNAIGPAIETIESLVATLHTQLSTNLTPAHVPSPV